MGLALLYSWPLPAHFTTRAIGNHSGDTGIILWDMWHFHHALTALRDNPLWTDLMYWPLGGNLLLTNYTLFNDAVSYFLAPRFGWPAAWNGIFLGSVALSGYGVFLMLRDWGFRSSVAFVSGALFAFSPALTFQFEAGRGLEYACFNAIPFFFWSFSRALRDRRLIDAALAALALTWVWTYNYYYFVICALLIPLAWARLERPASLSFARREAAAVWKRLAEAGALVALVLAARAGQRQFRGAGGARELLLYAAPYLAFWACAALRAALAWRPSFALERSAFRLERLKPYLMTAGLWAAMNLPMIVTVVLLMGTGDYGTTAHPWRGGGDPVDLLWLVIPPLFHPLWGDGLRALLKGLPFGDPNIISMGLVPTAAALWLWTRGPREKWTSFWLAGWAFCFVMTLGPWLKVLGVHLYLPLPFYLLHLLPVYNNMPNGTMFQVFATLFAALLSAVALREVIRRVPPRAARWVPAAALALLAFEFAPRAHRLFPLRPPPLAERFGRLPDGAFLPVPLGVNFPMIVPFGALGEEWLELTSQMAHHKPRVGGFLPRVARRVHRVIMSDPFIVGLLDAQAGRPVPEVLRDRHRVARWLRDNHVSYVLVETGRLPRALADAMALWPLKAIDAEGTVRLYEVTMKAAKSGRIRRDA